MKNKFQIWDWLLVAFVLAIFGYGVSRTRYEMRWSSWALGDAQNLNAAIHYADEGFRTHYFLIYYHPGFLGKSFGNESPVGYYTRYPPFSAILNGVLVKWFGDSPACLKSVAVAFAAGALLFCYLGFAQFFSRRAAFFGTLLVGSSVGFLEFLDCISPYMYSEFFRFLVIFLFLVSERLKEKRLLSTLLLGLVWLFAFTEAFNSLDYIIFLQLFFWLYYFLSNEKMPWGKLAFLAAAPVLSFALHYYQSWAALHQFEMSASGALLKGFEDKMAPFRKGPLHVLSFLTYFCRIMEGYMVGHNYGFGFGVVFLMYGAAMLLKEEGEVSPAMREKGFTVNKALLLFAIPSVSWWIVFSNHAASFFYTAMHAFPIIGLLFGLCFDRGLAVIGSREKSPALKTAALFVLVGAGWSIFVTTGKYLKDYPNLIDPKKRITLGEMLDLNADQVNAMVRTSRRLREKTSFGDIVLVPKPFRYTDYFFGYFAQRRLDYYGGETAADLKQKIDSLERYRVEGARKYPIFNPRLKLFALTEPGQDDEIARLLAGSYALSAELEEGWKLYDLDLPLRKG